MESLDVKCSLQRQIVKIQLDLLLKQPIDIENNEIIFPEYVSMSDLNLYSNFLASGYLNPISTHAVLRILLVADILEQKNICSALLSTIIIPSISCCNCLSIAEIAQNLTEATRLQIIVECVSIICTNICNFIDKVQFMPQYILNRIFERLCNKIEYRDILLDAIMKSRQCNNFIELLINEEDRLENMKIFPDIEMSWKINLSSDSLETDYFIFEENQLKIKILSNIDLEVFINENLANSQQSGLCRGLILFQGTSGHFYHLFGTDSQQIAEISKKTNTSNLKLILRNESLLYFILGKASDEISMNYSLEGISKTMILLIIRYLKINLKNKDHIIKVIAKWLEYHPQDNNSEIFDEYPWQMETKNSILLIADKYPALKSILDFRNSLNEKIMAKRIHQEISCNSITNEIPILDEDHLCPPLSPSGNPFILDISDIRTAPTTLKKFNFEYTSIAQKRLEPTNANLSENDTTCKYSRTPYSYSSPARNSKASDKQTALELIKELKRKVSHTKSHRRNRSLMHLVYPLFDNYKLSRK